MADVFTATKGRSRRSLRAWIARAASSLPTPVSPVMSTGALERATKSMAFWSARIAGPKPTIVTSGSRTGGETRRLALGRRRPSSASVTDPPQGVRVARLGHILEGPAADGVDRLGDVALARDDDERQGGVGPPEAVEQVQPAHPVHDDVADHDVEGLVVDDLQCRRRVRRELADLALAREQGSERLPHLAVVVYDQQPRLHQRPPAGIERTLLGCFAPSCPPTVRPSSRWSREKVRARPAPAATDEELEKGIPLLLDQLITALRDPDGPPVAREAPPGRELTDLGVRVVQIVHDYERVFQAVLEVAEEAKTPIDVAELGRLHRCLDEAVSQAVTEYSRRRERTISEQETERLGILAHESRNALTAAMLSFQALQAGKVGFGGSTAGLLDRSLRRLSALVETSIAQVRIESGKHAPERVSLHDLVEDIEVGAAAQASALELKLYVGRVEQGVDLLVDRQLLAAAIGNLLQNAFKYTRVHGAVWLDTSWTADRVRIAVKGRMRRPSARRP